MEVHSHTHTERKKFTHYLWEFLMLFLAVFCGFLAENFREHTIEHQRAKQYAQSLLKDLQNDTAEIRRASLYEEKTVLYIDSIIQFVKDPIALRKTGMLYYYARIATWFYNVDWNRATMNQLINSGNLRYFNNPELVNKISLYNTSSNIIMEIDAIIDEHRQRAIALRERILKADCFQKFMDLNMEGLLSGSYPASIDSLRNMDLPLVNKDPDLLNNMANALLTTIGNRKQQKIVNYPKAVRQAEEVMALLKKEYHLQ